MMMRLTLLLSLVSALFSQLALANDPVGTPPQITRVQMQTSLGNIVLELYPEKAPVSVDNFLTYVDGGHYDGLIFHRVIANFMVQTGGYTADMIRKATLPPIKNEADNGLKNIRGSLAMARTHSINSATSQFFINVVDNRFLNHGVRDYGYAVFGKVASGMEVVDNIAAQPVNARNEPLKPVTILKITRLPSPSE